MQDIQINNNTIYEINDICLAMCEDILEQLNLENVSMSINFVTSDEIEKINCEYRGVCAPTDVISFPVEGVDRSLFDEIELGDLFISLDKVYENSCEIGNTMLREFGFVLAHGILHLNGYTHENDEESDEMFSLQEELIKSAMKKGGAINEIFSR